MGSTFVDYQGRGFEAGDAALEVWLALLVKEVDALDDPAAWLREARDEWHLQATAGFGFGVMPGLDRFVTSEERRGVVVGLCERAMQRLRSHGATFTQEELNALHTGGDGAAFTRDVPAEVFERVGAYFMRLLQGRLGPDENDARLERQ